MSRPQGHGSNFMERKNEIVDLAARQFAVQGYATTSMADLEKAVKLGRGALYHYIGSKENLLVEVQSRVMVPLQSGARAIAALELDPVVRLRLLSEFLLGVMFTRLDHIWVYEHDYRSLTGPSLKTLLAQRKEFEVIVIGLIEEATASGSFREVNPRLAMLQFLNLHNRTYLWVSPTGPWTAEFLSREYCRTFVGGMRSDGFDPLESEARYVELRADVLPPLFSDAGVPEQP